MSLLGGSPPKPGLAPSKAEEGGGRRNTPRSSARSAHMRRTPRLGSAGRTVAGPGTQSPFLALAQVRDGGQRGTPKATVTQKHTDTLKQPRLIKPRAGTGQLRDDGVASRCRRSSSGRRPASLLRSRAQAPCRGHTSGRGSGKAVPADGRAVGGEHSVLCEYPHASIHCHVTPNARPPESARDRSRLSCFV